MRKLASLLSLTAASVLSWSAVYAQTAETFPIGEGYLYQEAQKDPTVSKEFAKITQPLAKYFPWVASYGTATPAKMIKIDGKKYTVYQGCKPHNCPVESYVVLYSPHDKKMVAGAFVQSKYEQNLLVESKVSWLGEASANFAPNLSPYLF